MRITGDPTAFVVDDDDLVRADSGPAQVGGSPGRDLRDDATALVL
jgi:hypothetical protein